MEKRGIGDLLNTRINVDPPCGDQMQNRHADFLQAICWGDVRADFTERGWSFLDGRKNGVEQSLACNDPPVAAE